MGHFKGVGPEGGRLVTLKQKLTETDAVIVELKAVVSKKLNFKESKPHTQLNESLTVMAFINVNQS